ncbi:MAG: hypothetical protein WB919_17165 [Candidatus Sulfotelmatobacter sp.]
MERKEMWLAATLVAIALTGAAFMIRFLIALLREGAPLVCFWVVPTRRYREKRLHTGVTRGMYFDDDFRATENNCGYPQEVRENKNYAKEHAPGLISLDVRSVSASLGRRSIRNGGSALRARRF